jgi:hypothetical protein
VSSWRWAILARLDAVWHLLRGHRVSWRVNVDDLCAGDIVCESCELELWCRAHDPRVRAANDRGED